jgi:AcrR family transcriptional regulator
MARRNKRRTERDRQREATRAALYAAALDAFRQDGVSDARIDEIASAAGVSRATFYFHFPTKEDVLQQLLEEAQAEVSTGIRDAPDSAHISDVLQSAASAMARQWCDEPSLLRAVGTVALQLTAQGLPESASRHTVQQTLLPRIVVAVERGELDGAIPAELLCNFFLINLFAAAIAWSATPALPLDLVLSNVTAFFLRGARGT